MISTRERFYSEPYRDGNSMGIAVLSLQGDVEFYSMAELLEEKEFNGIMQVAKGLWTSPIKFKEEFEEFEQQYYKIRDAGLRGEITDVDEEFTERVILPDMRRRAEEITGRKRGRPKKE